MGLSEFAALVEIIRMHKKKFRALERQFAAKSSIESADKTGRSSVLANRDEFIKASSVSLARAEITPI
jgi:hypothetical protein